MFISKNVVVTFLSILFLMVLVGDVVADSTSKYPNVLGTRVTVKEVAGSAVFDGTWTRRPGTDIFDAVWGSDKDVIEIESVDGNQIVLTRQSNGGHYYGTLSADGSQIAGGTASWYKPGWYWSGNTVEKNPSPPLVMGADGYPSNVIEVAPTRTAALEIFPSGKRFVWVAVNTRTVKPSQWAWKRYGPYDFMDRTRYYSHIGQIDFTVAPDYDARYSKPMQGESGLSFENIYGDKWVAFVIGDLLNASTTDYPNVSGIWTTNFGEMVIEVKNGQVTGTYTRDNGAIKGRIEGAKITGTWSEAPTYHGPEDAGDFEWVLDADGSSFQGHYRYGGSKEWNGSWTGGRTGAPKTVTSSPVHPVVGGVWKYVNTSDSGNCDGSIVTVKQAPDETVTSVEGYVTCEGGAATGRWAASGIHWVDADTLAYTYKYVSKSVERLYDGTADITFESTTAATTTGRDSQGNVGTGKLRK